MSKSFTALTNAESKLQFLLSVLGLKLFVTHALTACAFQMLHGALATHCIYVCTPTSLTFTIQHKLGACVQPTRIFKRFITEV